MHAFELILVLVVAVIASLPVARLLRRVPLPVVQIAIGAILAWPVTGGVHMILEPELFLLVFIPPLLFADAWLAPKREFWALRVPITSMAFGLVFFTILTFGYALHWLVPAVPLSVAFAAAAVLSPTDAVAVASIVDKDKLPPSLLHLLEGESLLNDASGLVMFRFATAAVLTGSFSLAEASVAFIYAVVAGAAIGFICLWLAVRALRILSKMEAGAAEAQVMVMILLPFLAYLLAEHVEASGVLAAVVAGMFLGRLGLFRYLGVTARMLAGSTWQMISFALNGALFVFLGLQLPSIIRRVPAELSSHHWLIEPIVIVFALTLCLMGLRLLFMVLNAPIEDLVQKWRGLPVHDFNLRAKLAGSVAGVRGAVTLAGVLSLPVLMPNGEAFPARDLVIFLAAGVILCWLAIATLLLPRLTEGLANDSHEEASLEMRHARIVAAQAAISRLEAMAAPTANAHDLTLRQAAAESLITSYRHRITALEVGGEIHEQTMSAQDVEMALRRSAIAAEAKSLRAMLRSGEINDHTLRTLMTELTLGEAMMATKGKSKARRAGKG